MGLKLLAKIGVLLVMLSAVFMAGFMFGYQTQQSVEETDCIRWLEYNGIDAPEGVPCVAYRFRLKLLPEPRGPSEEALQEIMQAYNRGS